MHSLLADLGVAVLVAAGVSYVIHRLKQPAVVGYLIAGIIIGPEIGTPLISDPHHIETISEIGLLLLLFIIGLEMHPHHVLSIFRRFYLPGTGQFLLTAVIGIGLFSWVPIIVDQGNMGALYFAVAASLSSTAIVIKALYDNQQMETYAGRLSIAILIFQDVWAILFLALQKDLESGNYLVLAAAVGKTMLLIFFAFFASRYVLKYVFQSISNSPEVIVTMSIGWATLVAALAGKLGISMEMGSLVAGIAISSFPYSMHVTAKVTPLRDFFLTLFFISLGMKIPLPELSNIAPALYLIGFALVLRFLTIVPLSAISGSSLRSSIIAAINLSQVSEFSLVIVALGVQYGHIHRDVMTITLYAMSVTAIVSSYAISANFTLTSRMLSLFAKLFRTKVKQDETGAGEGNIRPDICLLGYHRGTQALLDHLAERDKEILKRVCVIDFNREAIRELRYRGVMHHFGDISHMDVLRHAGIPEASMVIVTIPDVVLRGINNLRLTAMIREINKEAVIIAGAEKKRQVADLIAAGANEVILPWAEISGKISDMIYNYHKPVEYSEG